MYISLFCTCSCASEQSLKNFITKLVSLFIITTNYLILPGNYILDFYSAYCSSPGDYFKTFHFVLSLQYLSTLVLLVDNFVFYFTHKKIKAIRNNFQCHTCHLSAHTLSYFFPLLTTLLPKASTLLPKCLLW